MHTQDIVVWSSSGTSTSEADNAAIRNVRDIAHEYNATQHNGERLRIHLILHNQSLVDNLRKTPLSGAMNNVELYTYTPQDLWAISLLGIKPDGTYKLDFEPITYADKKTVHMVLLGCSSQAESLALHTSLIAHYPNYCCDNQLRTRITMIANSLSDFDDFRLRNKNLLSHCYLREVLIEDKEIVTKTFAPMYATSRRDFIDIEWEFVACKLTDNVLNYKLKRWATDTSQLTTFVYCDSNESANLSNALNLANAVSEDSKYQIFVLSATDDALSLLKESGKYRNVHSFGGDNVDTDCLSKFSIMAQLVNYAYCNMRESSSDEVSQGQTPMVVATDMPSIETLTHLWNRNDTAGNPKLNTMKRWSNIYNAYTIPSKMRSINLDANRWHELFAISDKDIDMLSEVEHNRWCVEELILGIEPTTDEQHAKIEHDVSKREYYKSLGKHDDLRNFHDLGIDDSGLSVTRYDTAIVRSIPLIAYSYQHNLHK